MDNTKYTITRAAEKLEEVITKGLTGVNSAYDNIGEFLLDWTMDFSWTDEAHNIEVEAFKKAYPGLILEFEKRYPSAELF